MLKAAWFFKYCLAERMGLGDLNSVEEACPGLCGASARAEKEKKKRMQLVVRPGKGDLARVRRVYGMNYNRLMMIKGMAGIRFAR